MRRLQPLLLGLVLGVVSVGCEETEQSPVVVPDAQPGTGPVSRPPQPIPPNMPEAQSDSIPLGRSATEEDVNVDQNDAADRVERREERRERLREGLDNLDVDVDAGATDVQVGEGGVNVDAEQDATE